MRQLIYDFKPWRKLEGTGRAGSDDGFDARGYEHAPSSAQDYIESQDVDEIVETNNDRLWLVQCKREKKITPALIRTHMADIRVDSKDNLYGIVFAAACDFSKKTRDVFVSECRELDVKECHLWGKAELEDMLFQPKNDHLLFAYFGISLTIQKRTLKSRIGSRLSIKRKAARAFDNHSDILIRSVSDELYPYSTEIKDFANQPPWLVSQFVALSHAGLKFCIRRCFAFVSDNGDTWDATLLLNDQNPVKDLWDQYQLDFHLRTEIYKQWDTFENKNKAWFELFGIISYDDVIDIDADGDDIFDSPHIYCRFEGTSGPFSRFAAVVKNSERFGSEIELHPSTKDDRRIQVFNETWRHQKQFSYASL